jgi:hypothetical protein
MKRNNFLFDYLTFSSQLDIIDSGIGAYIGVPNGA